MPEEIFYEFDSIRVSSLRPTIFHGEEGVQLTPTAFGLLLVFVQNPGLTVSKGELINRVWSNNIVTDNNFNVTLNAVRRALRDSGRQPRYIFKVTDGYRFIANVRVTRAEPPEALTDDPSSASDVAPDSQEVESTPQPPLLDPEISAREQVDQPSEGHQIPLKEDVVQTYTAEFPWTHLLVSTSLYSALYTCALLLEVAYQWNTFATLAEQLALPVFFLILGTSLSALIADWRLTMSGKRGSLLVAVLIFIGAAFLLYVALGFFLPNYPITEATFQTRSAHAAYLKDVSYFLPLGIIFIVLPFHFITSLHKQLAAGQQISVLALLSDRPEAVTPMGAIYVRTWWLGLLLCGAAVISLLSTNYLLDNLQPGQHKDLFTQLVMWRLLLYFALGLECLLWYYRALGEVKRESLHVIRDASFKV
jgi:DNA-binding winged helix-turn-helix (wHTH) protein